MALTDTTANSFRLYFCRAPDSATALSQNASGILLRKFLILMGAIANNHQGIVISITTSIGSCCT